MALDTNLKGAISNTGVDVNASNQLKIVPETNVSSNPNNVGAIRVFSENDSGSITTFPTLYSPESDNDYRLRVSQDILLDEVVFNYTAQDTGKHAYNSTTLANAWTAGQMTTNSGSITTTTTGSVFNTYACFPNSGTQTLSTDIEVGLSAAVNANSFIEFGLGLPSTALVAPADGVFIRISSAGWQGIASNNGTETPSGVFTNANNVGTFVHALNKKYQCIIYVSGIQAEFWLNDGTGAVKYATIPLPIGQGRICMGQGLQFFIKHRIVGGAAGATLQGQFGAYNIRLGGSNMTTSVSTQGNRISGSYQGFSGGTLGSNSLTGVVTAGNSANPTAAVPTTTTAALGSGLGGRFWETVSLAVNTDAIIMSFQVPTFTVNSAGRRLVLRGIYLNSYVQTVIVGGPYTAEWFLAFGHTSVSLATAEAVNTKAPRRIALPFTQQVTAAQAVQTTVAQTVTFMDLRDADIFVNPGEFVQLCTRHIGTAGTTGTIVHQVTPVFGWE